MEIGFTQMNWVDLAIFAILIYYAFEGVRHGFWSVFAGFISFASSLIIALKFYPVATVLLRSNFSISHSISNALGFLFLALITEILLSFFMDFVIKKLPEGFQQIKFSRIVAILPAVGEGLVLVSFGLTLLMGLPIAPTVKDSAASSKIGNVILNRTSTLESKMGEIFGGVIEDSLTHLTVKPGSGDTVPLHISSFNLTTEPETEKAMLKLINKERKERGIKELTMRNETIPVARSHAEDMWRQQYFSHYSPDGKDIGDRLEQADISYSFAGENLALAPTLSMAHTGLMNSEGHRENILEEDFKQVGIGVIDNGVYGKMFVQVFTD